MPPIFKALRVTGDFWGGFAAMLVALPSAIAFGVTIYSAIAPSHAALGALAGIIGAAVLGLLASTLGGTDRLISAPCAPAAAVLTAFAIEMVGQRVPDGEIILMLLMLGILTGLFQALFGFVGIGRLIKYIPYPVVSGYMTGVGLIIIGSQIDKLFGTPGDSPWYQSLVSPELWDWRALTVGAVTVLGAVFGQRLTRRVPGTILGVAAGVVTYFGIATQDPALLQMDGNALIVGPFGTHGSGYLASIAGRWQEIGDLRLSQVAALMGSALTLAGLLSIDTLKTCVVLDQLTRSQHNPNRELIAQGIANVSSSAIGGMPGAGTLGATLVNLNSGAETRVSGVIEGVASLVFALLLSSFVSWIPVSALAGILIVVGLSMIDREPLRFIQSRATALDFAVVVAVVLVALFVGLIPASGTGVALAILLFVREQIGGSVVRHKFYVSQMSSTWHRPETETRILEQKGDQAVLFELQGSLFFGTTQQLYGELANEIKTRQFVILDLKRVQSLDVTAAHMLRQVRDTLAERQAMLLFSNVRENLPNGHNLRLILDQSGITEDEECVRVFAELDNAIEWVEDRLLGEVEHRPPEAESALELADMELFKERKDETLADLEACLEDRVYAAGQTIYRRGQPGDAIYLIRRGSVKVLAPLGAGRSRHIATFGRGDFFGGLAFLDGRPHDNDAVTASETEVFILSRGKFDEIAEQHKRLALTLVSALSRALAIRLRHADTEVAMLHEY